MKNIKFWKGFSAFGIVGIIVCISSPEDLGIYPALFYVCWTLFGGYMIYTLNNPSNNFFIKLQNRYKTNIKKEIPYFEKELSTIENKNSKYYHNLFKKIHDGHEFEHFCSKLLEKNGFHNVMVTPPSNDYGVDIVAENDYGVKYGFQCKLYSSPLGNSPVQEISTGMKYYNCHVGVVITNSTFTKNAKELASSANIILWDKDKLNELINTADKK